MSTVEIESASIEDIEAELSRSYDDPVKSRILEAARAKLVRDQAGTQEIKAEFTLSFKLG